VIFYNRVPKRGSTTFVDIAYEVCGDNTFHVIHVNTSRNSHVLSFEDQERFVSNISNWNERKPGLYHGHISFIDFKKFGSMRDLSPIITSLGLEMISGHMSIERGKETKYLSMIVFEGRNMIVIH